MQRTNQNKPNWNVLLWPQALNANPFQLVIASQTSGRVLGPQEFHIKKDASKITTYGARCKHQPAFCRVPSQLVDSQQLGATFSSSLPWLCQSAGPKETAGSKFEVNIIMVATAPGAKKNFKRLRFPLGYRYNWHVVPNYWPFKLDAWTSAGRPSCAHVAQNPWS